MTQCTRFSAHNVQMSPGDLKHRYVTEDIPFGVCHARVSRQSTGNTGSWDRGHRQYRTHGERRGLLDDRENF